MRSRGIWLTVLMRGCKLKSLTPLNGGTTSPISYTQCYVSGWRIIGALNLPRASSRQLVHNVLWLGEVPPCTNVKN